MKITFFVSQEEYTALVDAAIKNLRNVPDQAHRFVLDGLEKQREVEEEPHERTNTESS